MNTKSVALCYCLLLLLSCKETKEEIATARYGAAQVAKIKDMMANEVLTNFTCHVVPEELAEELDKENEAAAERSFLKADEVFYPSAFKGRVYPEDGLEGYRDDLSKLVGLIATKRGEDYSVGIVSFAVDSPDIKVEVPKNGTLVDRKLEKKNEKKLGWILSVALNDDQMLQYTIQDQSRAVLTDRNIDFEKIGAVFDEDNASNQYLIVLATSTEITYRTHNKKGRRISFSDIPVLGAAFSANSAVYVSKEALQRDYKVGLRLVSIKSILEQLGEL
ncbi:MAG: hypothetical protein AB3N14_03325 [Flavobacteriaceae bacterium]